MSPKPTGHLQRTASGADLIIKRQFRAPIDDVWQGVTDPESTARWIGRWSGEPGPGNTVRLQMGFEKDSPISNVTIEACEPPARLAVCAKDEQGEWHLELALTHSAGTTELTFVQHLTDPALAGDVGPGWEYYLDMLVAARTDQPKPEFSDYYPSQRDYYLGQASSA